MKQGETKKLVPKDKHTKESWKRRDAGRKGLQEAHATQQNAEGDALTRHIEEGIAFAQFEEDHLGVERDTGDPDAEARASENA